MNAIPALDMVKPLNSELFNQLKEIDQYYPIHLKPKYWLPVVKS